jgi:hypothetical protein
MECQLGTSEEFQELKKRLLTEVKKLYKTQELDHSPVFRRLMEKKIQLIGDTLEAIDRNPEVTMHELSCQIEDRIDVEEKEIDDAQRFEEKQVIYHRISAYEWIFGVIRAVMLKYKR